MSIQCKKCTTANKDDQPFCKKCGFPLATSSLELEGEVVGNYKLTQRIGGGGFGEVYRAEHVELGNPFAVKILHPRLAKDEQFVERFRHEAMVLAGLQHENVVQVVDFGQKDDLGFYLVMEWIEGRTLHRLWRQKRVLPWGTIYALFSQLLDALQLAHDSGIVHRDMKPENLMLARGSRNRTILKIVDFGIATILHGSSQSVPQDDPLSQNGLAIGTPYYMSPEQAAGKLELVDHRSDLYACGVIFAEVLTGRRLFRSKDPKQILRKQLEETPPTLAELNPNTEYPDSFQQILDRALSKQKTQRYRSATEFYEDLAAAMDALGVQPSEEDPATPSQNNMLAALIGDEAESSPSTGSRFNGQRASGAQSAPSLDELGTSDSLQVPTNRNAFWVSVGIGIFIVLLMSIQFVRRSARSQTSGTPSGTRVIPPPPKHAAEHPAETKHSEPPAADTADAGPSPTPPPQKAPARKRPKQRPKRRPRRRPKRRLGRKASRWLHVRSKPSRARIYLNGAYQGKTPKRIRGRRGRTYRVQLKKKGYITKKYRWKVTRNKKIKFKLIEDLF